MKRKITIFGIIIAIFISVLGLKPKATVDSTVDASLINGALSGILIEEESMSILYQKDIHKRLSPASMTKIMTLLLTYQAIEEGKLTKNTILTVDEYSSKMGGSQVYLKVGEKISVDEVLKSVCIASANDCAVLLAVNIAGSEALFVEMMNKKATELGCKDTLFSDCSGLSSKNHYSSSYDMALIARELILKYPDIFTYTSLKEEYIRKNTDKPFWLVNTNKLIGRVPEVDGLKTGYCSFSGYNITLHMKKNGMGLISVVFGYQSSKTRNEESLELLNYGFINYEMKTLLKKDTLIDFIESPQYTNKIEIRALDNIRILGKKGEIITGDYTYNYYIKDDKLLGELVYKVNNNTYKTALYTNSRVHKRSFLEMSFYLIARFFN